MWGNEQSHRSRLVLTGCGAALEAGRLLRNEGALLTLLVSDIMRALHVQGSLLAKQF